MILQLLTKSASKFFIFNYTKIAEKFVFIIPIDQKLHTPSFFVSIITSFFSIEIDQVLNFLKFGINYRFLEWLRLRMILSHRF